MSQRGRGVLTDQVNMSNDIQLRMEIRGEGRRGGQLQPHVRIGPDGTGEVRSWGS